MDNTLRVRRAEKGERRSVSQLEVARATRIERNRYWRIEQGDAEPTPAEVKALARYFRCAAAVLFPSLAKAERAAKDGNGEAASVA